MWHPFLLFVLLGVFFCTNKAYGHELTAASNETAFKRNSTDGSQQKMTRKQLSTIAKDFTNYYLYFGEKTDTTKNNGGIEIDVCFPNSFKNTTHRLLSYALQGSVRRNYISRILSRSQISWKTKSEVSKTKNSNSMDSTDGSGQNGTSPNVTEATANSESEEKDRNRIHQHLIFVVLLPHHPYSQDLRKIITTVAPMYPHATTVLGNAYEFKEMTSKYLINSYPKILYFKMGIFVETYEGEYEPGLVAAKFAEWTHSLPRAIPVPFRHTLLAKKTPQTVREFDIYAPGAHMRHGLSLQPLPLTAQYVVLNVTLPEWVLPFVPAGVSYLNNSRLIEQTAAATRAALPPSHRVPKHIAAEVVQAGGETATDISTQSSSAESTTSNHVSPIAPQCSEDGTCVAEQGATVSTATTGAMQDDAKTTPLFVVDSSTDSATATATASTAATAPAAPGVPLVVSITVPMPNMEPFLGSVENYAVWDTRVFLLAGTYTIARFIYVANKWIRAFRQRQ